MKCISYDSRDYRARVSVCVCVCVCVCILPCTVLGREQKLHKKQTPPPYCLPWSQSTDMPIFRASNHVHGHACAHVYTCIHVCILVCTCVPVMCVLVAHVPLSCVYSCVHVPIMCILMCPCAPVMCVLVCTCPCQGEHSRACAHISLPLPSLTQAGGGISHVFPSQRPRHHS